jgi:protein TonB
MLLEKIVPTYPARAQQEMVEGEVVLQALISKDGTIADLRPISGPQVLSDAAMNAVKRWRFKPYLVNGKPVEVQTNIRVNFALPRK